MNDESQNADRTFPNLSWTQGWDEPHMGWDIEWETTDAGHGRYTWINNLGQFSSHYVRSEGGKVAPEPTRYAEAKRGECLGEFKSKSEALRVIERHHESETA